MLTLREAADVLRLSRRTVREYIQRGEDAGGFNNLRRYRNGSGSGWGRAKCCFLTARERFHFSGNAISQAVGPRRLVMQGDRAVVLHSSRGLDVASPVKIHSAALRMGGKECFRSRRRCLSEWSRMAGNSSPQIGELGAGTVTNVGVYQAAILIP